MVFCGRPSKACESCRKRRIKCDQQRPKCSTCIKTGRICPGYRDLTDVVFRDESTRVINKHHKSTVATPKTSPSAHGVPVRSSKAKVKAKLQSRPLVHSTHVTPDSMDWPIDDVALNYIFASCLTGSRFSYIPTLYHRCSSRELIHPAVIAVGLATLASHNRSSDLHCVANTRYLQAIKATNAALRCPSRSRDDDVLASVLLLSRYEIIQLNSSTTTHPTPSSSSSSDSSTSFTPLADTRRIQAWKTHVDGALAIAAARGDAQFADPIGRALFSQVAASVRVYCVQQTRRTPVALRRLVPQAQARPRIRSGVETSGSTPPPDRRHPPQPYIAPAPRRPAAASAYTAHIALLDAAVDFFVDVDDRVDPDPANIIRRAGQIIAQAARAEELLDLAVAGYTGYTGSRGDNGGDAPGVDGSGTPASPPSANSSPSASPSSPAAVGVWQTRYATVQLAQTANTILMIRMRLYRIIHETFARATGCHAGTVEEIVHAGSEGSPATTTDTGEVEDRQWDADVMALVAAAPIETVAVAHAIIGSVAGFFPPPTPSSWRSDAWCGENSNGGGEVVASASLATGPDAQLSAPLDASKGYFLIWPLYSAGSSSLIPPSTRQYIIDQLYTIAAVSQIPEAADAANVLASGKKENWMPLCHVF